MTFWRPMTVDDIAWKDVMVNKAFLAIMEFSHAEHKFLLQFDTVKPYIKAKIQACIKAKCQKDGSSILDREATCE